MKLRPESEKLLVKLVREFQQPLDGWSGALAAVNAGLLAQHGQYRADVCTEPDCQRAIDSLRELAGWDLITLFPANVTRVGLNGAWEWLFRSVVFLTPEGIRYVEKLNYPWYRKWWNKIPSDFKALIITVLGVIIATLLMHLFHLI